MKSIFEKARRRAIPVPQAAVNFALPYLTKDVPEIRRLEVKVHEGSFDVRALVTKVTDFEATLRFEIAEVDVGAERQIIRLRQISPADLSSRTLAGKVALLVVQGLFVSLVNSSPSAYARQDGRIAVDGDVYTVDLGALGLTEVLSQYPALRQALRLGPIRDIRCAEGAFEVVPGIGLETALKYISERLDDQHGPERPESR